MKKTLFITCMTLFFNTLITIGQTNVSGLISTNSIWTFNNSPYIITGSILVNYGVQLDIEPGVIIKFNNSTTLQVNGKLNAIGTKDKNIIFTSSQSTLSSGSWNSILFSTGTTLISTLKNCQIQYGGSSDGMIVCNVPTIIDSCKINNSKKAGIYVNGSHIDITNSSISNNDQGIVFQNNINGNIKISNNEIKDNTKDGLYLSIWSSKAIVENNSIISSNTGISVTNPGGSGGYNVCTINQNKISKCSTGVYVYGSGTTLTNNILDNNNIAINIKGGWNPFQYLITRNVFNNNITPLSLDYWASGSGGYKGDVSICYNKFLNNNSSSDLIFLRGDYNHGYGTEVPPDYNNYKFQYNTLQNNKCVNLIKTSEFAKINYNNFINNTNSFIIVDNDNSQIQQNATSNFWNNLPSDQIDKLIFDWFDNSSYGLVNYTPVLNEADITSPISSPQNVTKVNNGNGVLINWTKNSEKDLKGYKIYYDPIDDYTFSKFIDVGNITSYILTGVSLNDIFAITAYDMSADGINDIIDGNESWYSYAVADINSGFVEFDGNNKIKIYPNPIKNELTIDYMGEISYEILNLMGRVVSNGEFIDKTILQTSSLSSGVYLIKLKLGDTFKYKKIIKE